MKLSLILLFLFGYICSGNEIWYQSEMSTYVVPPFQNVYTTLQTNIFDKLLIVDFNSLTISDDALPSFASYLYCEVEKLIKYLDICITGSNNIRIKVDNKLLTITNDIKAKENEIARTDGQIRDMNNKIQEKKSQINAAEQSVRQTEGLVADAQNALKRAEKEVEDAKLCQGLFGRKKRFLGNLWNSIGSAVSSAGNAIESAVSSAGNAIESAVNTAGNAIIDNVVKPVCSVINFQQVDNARRNVENRKNELTSFKNQVQTFKNDLNQIQNDLIIFNSQLYNLNYQLNQLKNSLIALPNEQHIILLIHQKLINVVTQIRNLFLSSTSFFDTIISMIHFESIVKPLNEIYDILQQNQLMTTFNNQKITNDKINEIKLTFQTLITSISSIPINMTNIRCQK